MPTLTRHARSARHGVRLHNAFPFSLPHAGAPRSAARCAVAPRLAAR